MFIFENVYYLKFQIPARQTRVDNVVIPDLVVVVVMVVDQEYVTKEHVVLNIHLVRDIRMSAHFVVPVVESDVANTNKKCLFLTFSLKTLLNHRNLTF